MPDTKSKIKNQKSKVEDKVQKSSKKEISVKPSAKSISKPVKNVISVDLFDLKGKAVEKFEIPSAMFDVPVNKILLAQAVRVYLANQRRGTSSTKTRGEVQGSSRKIYKQKGTGRARHGSIRAPIFVHGGIVSGPKPRDHSLNFPKKMRRTALFSALSAKLKDGEIKFITGLEKVEPKTKEMVSVIKNLNLDSKDMKAMLVVGNNAENIIRSVRNIAGIVYTPAQLLNSYEVLNAKTLLIAKDAVEVMKKTFLGDPSTGSGQGK